MKKVWILFFVLALATAVLLSGCGASFETVSAPEADPADQKFNTVGKFLPATLYSESGEELEAAVKVEVLHDFPDKDKILEQILVDKEEWNPIYVSEGWENDQMRLIRIRLLVMPWGDSDFKESRPDFTVFAGMYINGNGWGGPIFGPEKMEPQNPDSPQLNRDTPSKLTDLSIAQTTGMMVDLDDDFGPYAFYYSPVMLVNSDQPYYETIICAYVPKEEYAGDIKYMVAFTNEGSGQSFATLTFEDIPTEGKYVWLFA